MTIRLSAERHRESGAVAVMTAVLMAFVLLPMGALAVDLGNAWARKRAIQNVADLAALAGAAALPDVSAARAQAIAYVDKNKDTLAGVTPAPGWATDADPANGSITFYSDANGNGRVDAGEQTSGDYADFIRVVPPPAKVSFGLARAMGMTETSVQLPATARVGTPLGVGMPPFFLTVGDGGANTCVKDDSHRKNPHNSGGVTDKPAPHPTGTPVLVRLSPDHGQPGASLTLVGAGFAADAEVHIGSATVPTEPVPPASATSLTVRVPNGEGHVQVWVEQGKGKGNKQEVSVALDFTIDDAPDVPSGNCSATSSNRGYIDEPRLDGNSQSIELNIKTGMDHGVHTYSLWPQGSVMPRATPGQGVECSNLDQTFVRQSGPSRATGDVNCVRLRTGDINGALKPGFFDSDPSSLGRMYRYCSDARTSSGPNSGIDGTSLFQAAYVDTSKGSPADLKAALISSPLNPPHTEWITSAVFHCPRFALLPVVDPSTPLPEGGNHYYPVVGFKAVYIDDDTADRGFVWGNGNALESVRGYVFDLRYLPREVSAADAGSIGPYLGGDAPKTVVLVHDLADRPT